MVQEVDRSTNEFGMGSGRPSDQTEGTTSGHSGGRHNSVVGKLIGEVESIFQRGKHHERGERKRRDAESPTAADKH